MADCFGAYGNVDYSRFVGENGKSSTLRFHENIRSGKGTAHEDIDLSPACKACEHPIAENADLVIGLVGVDTDNQLIVTANTPQGETVLDKYVDATGGPDAYKKINNRLSKGYLTMDAMPGGAAMKTTMTSYEARPNKNYALLEGGPMGKVESGTDGEIAWQMTDRLVRDAQAVFLPVWEATAGNDGYVSFELDPLLEDCASELSHDQRVTQYVEQGREWSTGHQNRMIKVPATRAGLAALGVSMARRPARAEPSSPRSPRPPASADPSARRGARAARGT